MQHSTSLSWRDASQSGRTSGPDARKDDRATQLTPFPITRYGTRAYLGSQRQSRDIARQGHEPTSSRHLGSPRAARWIGGNS